MAKLTLPDLLREKSVVYLKKIVEKIDKKDPFTRVGGEVGKTTDNVYLEFNNATASDAFRQLKGLKYKDIPDGEIFRNAGNIKEGIRLSGIQKTTELGSGTGSGGGAEKTGQTESMCCYFVAYLFNGKIDKFDLDLNYQKDLTAFYKNGGETFVDAYYKSKYSFKDLIGKAPTDEEWMQTYMATANKIKSSATKFTKTPVYFHRGSPFMDSIYAKKKRCEKHNRDLVKSKEPPKFLKESLTSFSNDKWNPGDIWMSTNKKDADPFTWTPDWVSKGSKKHICDWPNLQQSVYESAIRGETLGISLKKTGRRASLEIFNLPTSLASVIPSKYVGYKFGSGDFFNSTDVYLQFSDGKMQYRPTDGSQSWQGEIKGTKASGGKAGGGATNYYIELRNGDSSSIGPTKKKVTSGKWSEKKGKVSSTEKKTMYEQYVKYNENGIGSKNTVVKYNGSGKNSYSSFSKTGWKIETKGKKIVYTSLVQTVSEDDFMILGNAYKNSSAFWFGKYMALYLVEALAKPGDNNGFAKNIVRYAQSSIDNVSTFFWKIS